MPEFLENSYAKQGVKIEKKIYAEHKKHLTGISEADAKEAYIKLAQELETFGVHFFLVKV